MLTQKELLSRIDQIVALSSVSKIQRLMHQPAKYIKAIWFKDVIYPFNQQDKQVKTDLFFDAKINILLPSATDIYLLGGKSHDSETRLAKYLVQQLNSSTHFFDIGAHYGYFTMLANEIIEGKSTIFSFEPTVKTYELLALNTKSNQNIKTFNNAVSDKNEYLKFYEFGNKYSEYNSLDIAQYEDSAWFKSTQKTIHEIQAIPLDEIIETNKIIPDYIKIDVEGAEFQVMKGAQKLLTNHAPTLIMEYVAPDRKNEAHQKAVALLRDWGYKTFIILHAGTIEPIEDIDTYLMQKGLESDNIVIKKSIKSASL